MKEYYSKCYDLKLPDNKNRVLRKCRLVQFQGVQFLDIQSEPFWDYQEGPPSVKDGKREFQHPMPQSVGDDQQYTTNKKNRVKTSHVKGL